jgi:hypothetical protein
VTAASLGDIQVKGQVGCSEEAKMSLSSLPAGPEISWIFDISCNKRSERMHRLATCTLQVSVVFGGKELKTGRPGGLAQAG